MSSREPLSSHQKLSLGVLAFIGITTVVFGMFQMSKAISKPFERKAGGFQLKSAEQVEQERIAALKSQDSDKDGLTDYDEMYMFRTSPFLPDSDSDGISDKDEIAQSSDPNCPKGKTCRQARVEETAGAATTDGASTGEQVPPAVTTDDAKVLAAMDKMFGGSITDMTPEAINARLQELTPEELRKFLLDIGAPADMVNKTDDATLRSVLQETLTQMQEE